MSIKITCLQCGATRNVNDRLAGRRVRCPECDTAIHVPELSVEPEPVSVEPVDDETDVAESVAVEAVPVEAVAAGPVVAESDEKAAVAATSAAVNVSPEATSESNLIDDDDDDGGMTRPEREEDELDMTPMVDVTFLLLIFFVVTASFQLQKSIMMPRQQTDAPSTNSVEEDPEELDQVELQIDEEGSFMVITDEGEKDPLGKQALISTLKEARADKAAKLIIKVQEQCQLQALVDGMDAGTIAGYEDLQVTQVEEL